MSTIDNKEIIKTILENDGTYPSDPQCHGVYAYHNLFSNKWTFSICMTPQSLFSLQISEAVGRKLPLWTKESGLTTWGERFLEDPNLNFEDLFIIQAS